MARGVQLLQLRTALRDEVGLSNDVNLGVADVDLQNRTLRRVQENLYDEYDWPHLRVRTARIPLAAGQRYYDVPADLNYERIETFNVWQNGVPLHVERGISIEDYHTFDPEAGQRSDPPLKWDVVWTGTKEQIELWPVPASNNNSFQIQGIRKLRALTADVDVCDIDERLIVLFAAAEFLSRAKAPDAEAKGQQAQQLFSRLKGRSQGGSRTVRMGLGPEMEGANGRAVVRISG